MGMYKEIKMEFKVFKNENSKILKEYWLTQSEWDALDKTTVQEGDIYHIVGTIDKGDLSADVNASLAKGDSSLQKPTTTLAKESFVKVGIDGTEKFDESSYVVSPSTDGTAGQVLKKTETGTEWADESGGGGGGGTNVVANPGNGSTRITDIQIGNTKYFILPAKYEQYLKDNTFTEPTVTLAVIMETQPVKDNKYLYGQTVVASISHIEVKNDATSLNNLTLYWRGSSIQSNIVPSIGTTTTIISSGSYKLSTSNNKFQLKLPYVADGDSGSVSSYKDIPSGYALWYGAGDAATRLDTTNIKNIVSSGSVNISVETTASQKITIMSPGTVTAKTNASFSTDVPLTKTGTVSLPVYSGSSGTTILADAVTYNIYQTEPLKAGTNDITLTLTGGN